MEMLRVAGAETLSADDVAHDVLRPGTPESEAVIRRFGQGIVLPDGGIDRRALGEIIFADPNSREILNSITHPRIIAILHERIQEFRARTKSQPPDPGPRPSSDVLAIEIPLLVECHLADLVDKVIVVSAEQDTQINRLTTRGLSVDEARARVDSQLPLREKLPFADWVVRTDGTFDDTRRQVGRIIEQINGGDT